MARFGPQIVRSSNLNVTYSGNFPGTHTSANTAICPDLLTIHDLGVADNLRGRVVRGFFRLLEVARW